MSEQHQHLRGNGQVVISQIWFTFHLYKYCNSNVALAVQIVLLLLEYCSIDIEVLIFMSLDGGSTSPGRGVRRRRGRDDTAVAPSKRGRQK